MPLAGVGPIPLSACRVAGQTTTPDTLQAANGRYPPLQYSLCHLRAVAGIAAKMTPVQAFYACPDAGPYPHLQGEPVWLRDNVGNVPALAVINPVKTRHQPDNQLVLVRYWQTE